MRTSGTPLAAGGVEHLRIGLARISDELRTGTLAPFEPRVSPGETTFVNALRGVLAATPRARWARLAISFNEDQVESKLWLIRELPEAADLSEHRVVILGAWYGLLALLLEQLTPRPPADICCIDIDEDVCDLATQVLSVMPVPPSVRQADMMSIDYEQLGRGRPTIFINTSCEHLDDVAGWRARVPRGTRLVVQSNNHAGCPEHISSVRDIETFEQQISLASVDFRGVLPLRNFKRFMIMGCA